MHADALFVTKLIFLLKPVDISGCLLKHTQKQHKKTFIYGYAVTLQNELQLVINGRYNSPLMNVVKNYSGIKTIKIIKHSKTVIAC